MYARRITMQLKPNCVAEFTRKLESDVLPMLKKQAGFKDEITFLTQDDKEVLAISLWDKKENAEAYDKGKYADVLKMLGSVIDGKPHVKSGKVTSSTFHKVVAGAQV